MRARRRSVRGQAAGLIQLPLKAVVFAVAPGGQNSASGLRDAFTLGGLCHASVSKMGGVGLKKLGRGKVPRWEAGVNKGMAAGAKLHPPAAASPRRTWACAKSYCLMYIVTPLWLATPLAVMETGTETAVVLVVALAGTVALI